MGKNSTAWLSSVLGVVAALLLAQALPAWGRDLDGRYRDSPLHDWFEHLGSGKGSAAPLPMAIWWKMLTGKPRAATIVCAYPEQPTLLTRSGSMYLTKPWLPSLTRRGELWCGRVTALGPFRFDASCRKHDLILPIGEGRAIAFVAVY